MVSGSTAEPSPGNTVRAAPIGGVAFVTRTSDDVPAAGGAGVRGAAVPGYGALGEEHAAEQPCSLKGLTGGLAAGVLGFAFGFVPAMFRHRSLRLMSTWTAEGWQSAKAFAVMSGIYTTVQCLCERIRQQDDGLNRIIAGGASGFAVAWKSGFVGALQSGAFLAVVSWLFDFGTTSTAKAAALPGGCSSGSCAVSVGRFVSSSCGPVPAASKKRLHLQLRPSGMPHDRGVLGLPTARHVLDTPAVVWLGQICNNRAYFSQPALSMGS